VKDPGLFFDSAGRFYAYHHARDALKSRNGKQHHEVHVTEIREVEPDTEGFHRFERSLEPFLDVLMLSPSQPPLPCRRAPFSSSLSFAICKALMKDRTNYCQSQPASPTRSLTSRVLPPQLDTPAL
jgi:hypothetical protein